MSDSAKLLDQFYTNTEVAASCYEKLLKILRDEKGEEINVFIEPAAGSGSFYSLLPENKRVGYDLDPKCDGVEKVSFFDKTDINSSLGISREQVCFLGNPPFGKRSKLALEFFLHAANFGDTIAFIVPVQWHKWGVQSKIPSSWKLVHDEILRPDAFVYKGKPYIVRCAFQVWRKTSSLPNLRLTEKAPTEHPDFDLFLYNNTKGAMKFFDYDWDFAIPRQGYANYSRRETDKDKCEKTTQWMFIKAKNNTAFERLYNLDYESLAMKNTSTPGWGKADLVLYYIDKYSKNE
jgi:hypothetical protein